MSNRRGLKLNKLAFVFKVLVIIFIAYSSQCSPTFTIQFIEKY